MIENDLVEAIIALPENMFYNTGIGTFIWILSNRKEERRKGKIQLIDATAMKSPLRKNMGKKNCEFTPEIRREIVRIFMEMEQSEVRLLVCHRGTPSASSCVPGQGNSRRHIKKNGRACSGEESPCRIRKSYTSG